uniref:Uncharacterized protein n=1 Tax=uncultured bacterium contig00006 TaxID=1181498 RepID=A0A806JYJ1_9BACT|nr:hypothetical protein [uncultured bacterium contig00006]
MGSIILVLSVAGIVLALSLDGQRGASGPVGGGTSGYSPSDGAGGEDTPSSPDDSASADGGDGADDGADNDGGAMTLADLTGSWVGEDDASGMTVELAFDGGDGFYMALLEPSGDYNVMEGICELSGSVLKLFPQRLASFSDGLYQEAYPDVSDDSPFELALSLNAGTLIIEGDGDRVTMRRGTPLGVWEFGRPAQPNTSAASGAAGVDDLTRTLTLGPFQINNEGNADTQLGWCNDTLASNNGFTSPFTAADFTGAEYLVVEFANPPAGALYIVWDGDGYGWHETTLDPPQSPDQTVFVVALASMDGYADFLTVGYELRLLLCYYSDSWLDLPIVDAWLAVANA